MSWNEGDSSVLYRRKPGSTYEVEFAPPAGRGPSPPPTRGEIPWRDFDVDLSTGRIGAIADTAATAARFLDARAP